MPVNNALRDLARDGRFSVDDARKLDKLVQQGTVSQAEAQEAVQRYGDVMDPEASRLMQDFTGAHSTSTLSGLPPELLGKTLQKSRAHSGDTVTLQRALMTLGHKQQDPALTLPSGVDGFFGNETTNAVKAFQSAHRIAPTGIADRATLGALDQALREQGTGPQPSPLPAQPAPPARPTLGLQATATPVVVQGPAGARPGTSEAVAEAAQRLVDGPTSANYGVAERWLNNDPRHAAPTNKPINGTAGKWKCNLFAGNALAAAGFEPPYYGNRRTGGEYPNANQLYKWSDKYAAKSGNADHVRFQMRDEIRDMPNLTPEARRTRVEEMLNKLEPGDLLIADHVGTSVADGGHCRVYVGKDENGQHRFAMAGNDSALVRSEGAGALTGEEHLWILRPNTPRR